MDPRGMTELMPDWLERGCPVEAPVGDDAFWFLTEKSKIAAPILMTLLVQVWMPMLRSSDSRIVAAQLRAQGPGPYYFYGENISFPLVWEMASVMPRLLTPDDLDRAAATHPTLLAIAQTKSNRPPPPLPAGFVCIKAIATADQTFEIIRRTPSQAPQPPIPPRE